MMRDETDRPLSRERRFTALTIAAIAGTIAYLAIDGAGRNTILDPMSVGLWAMLVLFGSFIAVPVCLVIGMPLWYLAERAGWRSRSKAMQLGMVAGVIVGFGFLILDVADIGYATFAEVAAFLFAGAVGGLVAHGVAFGFDRR